ncbi:MAG: tetratricopeptide repeat protein [Proteobacteria bacterium]|nr:tetratricopeptide repeat protein [Pseudomonadota bacterium]
MTEYLTETQQIEMLKNWWRKYGNRVMSLVLVATIFYFSGVWWMSRQNAINMQASSAYEQLLITMMDNDQSSTTIQADNLISDYTKTPYAGMAQLILAKQAVYMGDLERAQQKLQWVVDHATHKSIQQIARLRMASLFEEKNQLDKGLKVLEEVNDPAFLTMIEEKRGDIYLTLGKKEEAKKAYEAATKALVNSTIARPLLKMKLENLN